MRTYYIYKINNPLKQLFKQYPNVQRKLLMLQPSNRYFSSQMEALFDDNENINEYLYERFKERNDYHRKANHHIISNQLTKEVLTCTVYDYSIEINAPKKENIFYDILYQYSKDYVIIDRDYIMQEVLQ